jgi:hypothetical protein
MLERSRARAFGSGILRVRGDSLDRDYIERWVRELGVDLEWARANNT